MTTNDLDRISQPRQPIGATSQATAIEQARSVAEVAAAVRVAQDNPRDEARALERIRSACDQLSLADRAFYSVPRAGGRVEGSTVQLAREMARCWGNNDYGIRELRRDDDAGESEMQAWAWDQETNVRSTRSFIVPHQIMVGKGADKTRKRLIDLTDIINNNNSWAARAVRETILTIVPVWFRVAAETKASETLRAGGGNKPLAEQVADMVQLYAETFNVTVKQLEEQIGRPRGEWTATDLGGLRILGGELHRGEKRVAEEFPKPGTARVTAEEIARTTKLDSRSTVGKELAEVLGKAGIAEDREPEFFSKALGRTVASRKDLSEDDARTVITALEEALAEDTTEGAGA